MKKRLLAVVLSMALAFTYTACGDEGDSESTVTESDSKETKDKDDSLKKALEEAGSDDGVTVETVEEPQPAPVPPTPPRAPESPVQSNSAPATSKKPAKDQKQVPDISIPQIPTENLMPPSAPEPPQR